MLLSKAVIIFSAWLSTMIMCRLHVHVPMFMPSFYGHLLLFVPYNIYFEIKSK